MNGCLHRVSILDTGPLRMSLVHCPFLIYVLTQGLKDNYPYLQNDWLKRYAQSCQYPLLQTTDGVLSNRDAVILVYSVRSMKSLEALDYFHQRTEQLIAGNPLIFLVGTQLDCLEDRIVGQKEGRMSALKLGAHSFCEVSARDFEQIRTLFEFITACVVDHRKITNIDDDDNDDESSVEGSLRVSHFRRLTTWFARLIKQCRHM